MSSLKIHMNQEDIRKAIGAYLDTYQSDIVRFRPLRVYLQYDKHTDEVSATAVVTDEL